MRLQYDGISPFTGNRTLLREFDEECSAHVAMCMDTGYQTYEGLWMSGSQQVAEYENSAPVAVVKTKHIDSNSQVWFRAGDVDRYGRGLLLPGEDTDKKPIWVVYKTKLLDTVDNTYMYTIKVAADDGEKVFHIGLDESSRVEYPVNKFQEAFDTYASMCLGIEVTGSSLNNPV